MSAPETPVAPAPGVPASGPTHGSTVRRALLGVAAAGTALAVVLAVSMVVVVRHGDREQALSRADRLARALSNEVVGPVFDSTADVETRTRRLDVLLGTRARDGSIVRIKIWTPQGEVLWADDHRLIGQRYPLAPEDQALVGTREAYAVMTDLDKPENAFEQALEGDFIEVYAGFFDTNGRPLVFEAYQPVGGLGSAPLRAELLWLALGWLVLLLAVLLPFAASLARRVDRAQAEQQRMLAHAVEAGELERKRLAQDLHDGVIQDLAGVGYVFSALEAQLSGLPKAQSTARRASDIVRRDVVALRGLCTDLYPPDLGGDGLESALEDMLDHCEHEGLTTDLRLHGPLALPPTTALLAYRVVREGLRNVVKHARATRVVVEVDRKGEWLVLRVQDDGRGFDTAAPPPDGHFGLRVLRDGVALAGGVVDLRRGDDGGTVLEASLPLEQLAAA